MAFKDGTDELIYIYDSGTYYPIGCVTGQSFSEGVDMLETTTRQNTNGWKTSIPTNQSYNIMVNALTTTTNLSSTVLTYEDLLTLKRDKTKIAWKIDSEVSGYADFGFGYIRSISRVAEIDSYLSFSIEIVGYGEPTRNVDTLAYLLNYDLNFNI